MKNRPSLLKLPGEALPREARLRLGHQYATVRNDGISSYGPLFRLSCLTPSSKLFSKLDVEEKFSLQLLTSPTAAKQQRAHPIQCGIIVSRRVGNAVTRNKTKRRFRELYRKERFRLTPGLWLVIIATKKAADAPLSALHAEWIRLGQRLSIFTTS